MKNKKIKSMLYSAIIAALYVVLTYIASLMGLSSGAIQLRFSEALTILPIFMPEAIAGLFVGCFISNVLAGGIIWDVIFGSLATLIAAILTRKFRKIIPLSFSFPILMNTLVIPPIVYFLYRAPSTLILTYITVFIGEFISVVLFGTILYKSLKKSKLFNGDINER